MITKEIAKYVHEQKKGIVLMPIPTGFGKTRSIVYFMNEYAKIWHDAEISGKNTDSFRRIIFVTPLKKNLPYEWLKSIYYNEKQFHKDVIKLKSNLDYVLDGKEILEKIPKVFAGDEWQQLLDDIESYKSIPAKSDKLQKQLSESINNSNTKFKKSILSEMKKDGIENDNAKLDAVRHNKKYQWIAKMYPYVLLDDTKINMMSVNKLIEGKLDIVNNYRFLSDNYLKGSVIFIDEFDSTKNYIINAFLENQLKYKVNLLQLFSLIYNSLIQNPFSHRLMNYNKSIPNPIYHYEEVVKRAQQIVDQFHVWPHPYKTAADEINTYKAFIFNDGESNTIIQNEHGVALYGKLEEDKDCVTIQKVKNKQGDDKTSINYIPISRMVAWVTGFVKYFSACLSEWSKQYMTAENAIVAKKKNGALMTKDEAFSSLLSKITDDNRMRQVLRTYYLSHDLRVKSPDYVVAQNYYANGFSYCELNDGPSHDDDTYISSLQMFSTPESVMLYMAQQALVFGVSATASVNTVTGNYSMPFLKDNLKTHLKDMMAENKILNNYLHKIEDNRYAPYKEGRIKVHVKQMTVEKDDCKNELINTFQSAEIAESIYNIIVAAVTKVSNGDTSDYYINKYSNIALVMRDFARHESIQTLLYLGMSSASDNDSSLLNKTVLSKIANKINKDSGLKNNKPIKLAYITSKNFDEDFSRIKVELSKGEKVFIFSTYQTVGAGQNLQYEVPIDYESIYKEPLVELNSRSDEPINKTFKDIDSIYLGDITHLVANFNNHKEYDVATLVKHIIQTEELYQNCEITPEEKKKMIRIGFNTVTADENKKARNLLRTKDSIKSMLTIYVVQALGRIGRTDLRNKNIFIYIDDKVLYGLNPQALNNLDLSPELEEIKRLSSDNIIDMSIMDRDLMVTIYANSEAAKTINTILSVSSHRHYWYDRYMDFWKDLREMVLKYPTITTEQFQNLSKVEKGHHYDEYMHMFYAKSIDLIDHYLFTIKNDNASSIKISFKGKQGFVSSGQYSKDEIIGLTINEVSSKSARLDVILMYEPIRQLWDAKGYAKCFCDANMLLTPVLFTNIYKGAIGELAGKIILEHELKDIRLKEIEDPAKFEKFDYCIEGAENIYIDFKHWNINTEFEEETTIKDICEKMEMIGAEKAFIVNIIKPGKKVKARSFNNGKVITVPYLIDENGKVAESMIQNFKF